MDKIILVDGNNLLFRSYYATAYNGNFMKNSKGFPTNALFGFTNMINKIVKLLFVTLGELFYAQKSCDNPN